MFIHKIRHSVVTSVAAVCIATLCSCELERPSEDDIISQGRRLFRDTKYSAGHDTSCETCHPDGHMDNRLWHFDAIHRVGDSVRTLTLWGIASTGAPYLWDASRRDLYEVTRLYTDTIMGGHATDGELEALVAYQKSLVFPSNPYVNSDGTLTPAQARGRTVYETKGLCSPCHTLPTGTNGKAKNIGTGGIIKTPGLRGAYSYGQFFHDGRAKSLREVIDFYDADTSGILKLSGFDINLLENEKSDLIEFLRTL